MREKGTLDPSGRAASYRARLSHSSDAWGNAAPRPSIRPLRGLPGMREKGTLLPSGRAASQLARLSHPSSCPDLFRASRSTVGRRLRGSRMDGRNKSGHDAWGNTAPRPSIRPLRGLPGMRKKGTLVPSGRAAPYLARLSHTSSCPDVFRASRSTVGQRMRGSRMDGRNESGHDAWGNTAPRPSIRPLRGLLRMREKGTLVPCGRAAPYLARPSHSSDAWGNAAPRPSIRPLRGLPGMREKGTLVPCGRAASQLARPSHSSSCPDLFRASRSTVGQRMRGSRMDGRNESGHDAWGNTAPRPSIRPLRGLLRMREKGTLVPCGRAAPDLFRASRSTVGRLGCRAAPILLPLIPSRPRRGRIEGRRAAADRVGG